MAEISDNLQDNAAAPQRATGDTGSVTQHSLPDQIEADRYLASKAASRKKGLGIKINRLLPPGGE